MSERAPLTAINQNASAFTIRSASAVMTVEFVNQRLNPPPVFHCSNKWATVGRPTSLSVIQPQVRPLLGLLKGKGNICCGLEPPDQPKGNWS